MVKRVDLVLFNSHDHACAFKLIASAAGTIADRVDDMKIIDINNERLDSFVEDSMNIYPHLTDQNLKGYTIDETERKRISRYSIDLIAKNNKR